MIKLYNILPEHVIKPAFLLPSDSCVVIYRDLDPREENDVLISIQKNSDIKKVASKEAREWISAMSEFTPERSEVDYSLIDNTSEGIVISEVFTDVGRRFVPSVTQCVFYVIDRRYKYIQDLYRLSHPHKPLNSSFTHYQQVPFSEVESYLPEI